MVQGRLVSELDLEVIRRWTEQNPGWSRRHLSQVLATHWEWRNGAGQLKDMAARTLLLKLEQHGLIALPPRRQKPTNRMRLPALLSQAGAPSIEPRLWNQSSIECSLAQLKGLEVSEVSQAPEARREVASVLSQFHYLGFGGTVGENLQYLVRDLPAGRQGGQCRLLGCLIFGAAAWKCQARDQFIGWSAEERLRNLGWIANNSRFLIPPWVRVPHLASWVLGQVSHRLSGDWQAKYGHPIVLLESFVQRDRFQGIAYRAANWTRVGATAGRTRQDCHRCIRAPVKDIYLYALGRSFREALRA